MPYHKLNLGVDVTFFRVQKWIYILKVLCCNAFKVHFLGKKRIYIKLKKQTVSGTPNSAAVPLERGEQGSNSFSKK